MGKAHIPKAVREQCWLAAFGRTFDHTCYIPWCANTITVFDFHVGHDTPESQGGTLDPRNLRPICAQCNLSMSNKYTIDEWNKSLHAAQPKIKASPCPPKKAHAKTKPRLTWRQWFASWFGYKYH